MTSALLRQWEALGRPLPRLPQAAALLLLAALMAAMGLIIPAAPLAQQAPAERIEAARDASQGDLALYARIAERVAAGEGYYAAAVDEQRARDYPTRPFVTVRLPTLALLNALVGDTAVRILAAGLLVSVVLALYFRLTGLVGPVERGTALVMLMLGGAVIVSPQAGLIHEVYAGLLLTIALLLHRPQRWWPSLLAAALALSVRELAAPFVLLWFAFALIERRWREAAAVTGLLALFALGLALHYHGVEAGRLPDDPASPGWDAMVGYSLPVMALSRLTVLTLLPSAVAGPLAILPLLGWFALGGRLGLFACLWFAGFLTAMALFARPENFYWAQLILPAYAAGFAFAPRALLELARTAFGRPERQA